MKTLLMFLLVCFFAVMPCAIAQDKDKPVADANAGGPPKPLDDAMSKWMIGDWSGTSESNMGTANETEKNEMSLDNQFVLIHLTSRMSKVNPEYLKGMAASMKISEKDAENMMKKMVYKGIGMITTDAKTGDYIGYWFDSWRGVFKGTGKLEGNKITMHWEGTTGSSVRTIEKDEQGRLVQAFHENDMSGGLVEGKSTYKRKK